MDCRRNVPRSRARLQNLFPRIMKSGHSEMIRHVGRGQHHPRSAPVEMPKILSVLRSDQGGSGRRMLSKRP
jgi:hypothetical protein